MIQQPIYLPKDSDRYEQKRTAFGSMQIQIKVSTEDTNGRFLTIEHRDSHKGGPPRHIHHDQEEWFYILKGNYDMEVGEEKFSLSPGDSVLAPRGIPHVWAFSGTGVGKLLITFSPAGQMESFFQEIDNLNQLPAKEPLQALFSAHGMLLTGPPLPVA